jgi:hypothetical protein
MATFRNLAIGLLKTLGSRQHRQEHSGNP